MLTVANLLVYLIAIIYLFTFLEVSLYCDGPLWPTNCWKNTTAWLQHNAQMAQAGCHRTVDTS